MYRLFFVFFARLAKIEAQFSYYDKWKDTKSSLLKSSKAVEMSRLHLVRVNKLTTKRLTSVLSAPWLVQSIAWEVSTELLLINVNMAHFISTSWNTRYKRVEQHRAAGSGSQKMSKSTVMSNLWIYSALYGSKILHYSLFSHSTGLYSQLIGNLKKRWCNACTTAELLV